MNMTTKLEGLFGKHWETTVWGGLAVIIATVAFSPEFVEFLPDKAEGYAVGVCKLLAAAFGITAFQKSAVAPKPTAPKSKKKNVK